MTQTDFLFAYYKNNTPPPVGESSRGGFYRPATCRDTSRAPHVFYLNGKMFTVKTPPKKKKPSLPPPVKPDGRIQAARIYAFGRNPRHGERKLTKDLYGTI